MLPLPFRVCHAFFFKFVETHSHAVGGICRESTSPAEAILAQGITTVLVNPDGWGPVDLANSAPTSSSMASVST